MATNVCSASMSMIRFPDADPKYYAFDKTCRLPESGQQETLAARRSDMRTQAEKAAAFRALHQKPGCFLIPNPWDAGTAKILTGLGYEALATTSLGVANNLGNVGVTREQILANSREIVEATDLPVNADLENCFAHEPAAAAETIRLA